MTIWWDRLAHTRSCVVPDLIRDLPKRASGYPLGRAGPRNICHPWIPAFVGMTKGMEIPALRLGRRKSGVKQGRLCKGMAGA